MHFWSPLQDATGERVLILTLYHSLQTETKYLYIFMQAKQKEKQKPREEYKTQRPRKVLARARVTFQDG